MKTRIAHPRTWPCLVFLTLLLVVSGCGTDRGGFGGGGGGGGATAASEAPSDAGVPNESAVVVISEILDGSGDPVTVPVEVVFGPQNRTWDGTGPLFLAEPLQQGSVRFLLLRAEADGFLPWEEDVQLIGGQVRDVAIRLEAEPEVPEQAPAAVVTRAAPPARMHRVAFTTTPPGARVTLQSSRDPAQSFTRTTPFELEVPPDFYRWSLEMAGHMGERSTQDLDLQTNPQLTINRSLANVSVANAIRDGDQAYERGQYFDAIRYYSSVPRPSSEGSPDMFNYLHARNRLGESFRLNQDFEDAIRVFEEVIGIDRRLYIAHLQLGITLMEVRQFNRARQHFSQVYGPLLNNVPLERRLDLQALATFYHALCSWEEFRAAQDATNRQLFGRQAYSELTEFLALMERTETQDPFLDQAVQDARNHIAEIERTLG